jgi:translation initiation factor 6 (eIF-6)
VALVDVLTFLDDVFEVAPAAGTVEAAGAAAVHDGMLAASVDLCAVGSELGLEFCRLW